MNIQARRRHLAPLSQALVFQVEGMDTILLERMAFEFYGYPADFVERYRAGIEKVTAGDVARVAQKYVHRDQMAVLVVGEAADFDKPLSSLGPVTTIDITIPEAPPGGVKKSTEHN